MIPVPGVLGTRARGVTGVVPVPAVVCVADSTPDFFGWRDWARDLVTTRDLRDHGDWAFVTTRDLCDRGN